MVIVATQGHGDEEAVTAAVAASPGFIGLVASAKRGDAVRGYLADRGVDRERLDSVVAPVGLDLGHTSHREIAVAILAELVRMRAAGLLTGASTGVGRAKPSVVIAAPAAPSAGPPAMAVDPICGMAVRADRTSHPVEYAGTTYYFCCVGCRDTFVAGPAAHLRPASRPDLSAHQEV